VLLESLSELLTSAGLLCLHWQVKFLQTGHAAFMNQSFFGITENKVITHIWITVAVNGLVAILKRHLNPGISLYRIREILSLTLFEKRPFYRYGLLSTIQN
jgi:hypothetical protein